MNGLSIGAIQRGSTPVHVLDINIDLRGAKVCVVYQQNGINVLEKTGDSLVVTEDQIIVNLTREDTIALDSNYLVLIQLMYILPDGKADASQIIRVKVKDLLEDGDSWYEDKLSE